MCRIPPRLLHPGGDPFLRLVGLVGLGVLIAMSIGWLAALAVEPLDVGHFGGDFEAYRRAAGRLLAGELLYEPRQLSGPYPSVGGGFFRYPPPFAFLIVPFTFLDRLTAAWAFVGVSLIGYLVGTLAGLKAAGLRLTRDQHVVWATFAVFAFLPVLSGLRYGNVDGLQAALLGLALVTGARVRAGLLSMLAWLKVAPAILLVAAARRDLRRSWPIIATSLALVIITLPFCAPSYAAYPEVLANAATGSATFMSNLAPAAVVDTRWPELATLATLLRAGTVVLAAALGWAMWRWAPRRDGWAAALCAGSLAGLLLPGTIWYHSLAALLPMLVFAWAKATRLQRLSLGLLTVLLDVAFFVPENRVRFALLATPAAIALFGLVLAVIRPGPVEQGSLDARELRELAATRLPLGDARDG